ncbi:hypothetical protein Ahia01_000137600 [Argonauta hians]
MSSGGCVSEHEELDLDIENTMQEFMTLIAEMEENLIDESSAKHEYLSSQNEAVPDKEDFTEMHDVTTVHNILANTTLFKQLDELSAILQDFEEI